MLSILSPFIRLTNSLEGRSIRDFPIGSREMVVAAYGEESIPWLDDSRLEDIPRVVYDKKRGDLPNVGREAHTYLSHILHRYPSFEDFTCFLHADAPRHWEVPDANAEQRQAILKELNSADMNFSDLFVGRIKFNVSMFGILCLGTFTEDRWGQPNDRVLYNGDFYRKLFECKWEDVPKLFFFPQGAQFIVSKEAILSRSKEFYERCLQCTLEDPEGPWLMERMWWEIFSPADCDMIREHIYIQYHTPNVYN